MEIKRELEGEIKSKLLKKLAISLTEVLDDMKSGKLSPDKARNEIAVHKHILQCAALDWAYRNKNTAALT